MICAMFNTWNVLGLLIGKRDNIHHARSNFLVIGGVSEAKG